MTAVFPVGHGAGTFVRVGRTAEQLTENEFGAWVVAHRMATVADLVNAGFERDVAGLLRRGVLVEVTDPVSFAHQYRLTPLFLGLGNRPDAPDRFAIGVPGLEPLATVDSAAYELWQWGWVAPSLWAHCEVLATIREQEGHEPATPDAQLGHVLGLLPSLLAGFVAVLEPVQA